MILLKVFTVHNNFSPYLMYKINKDVIKEYTKLIEFMITNL
jgi:hypothetical protein